MPAYIVIVEDTELDGLSKATIGDFERMGDKADIVKIKGDEGVSVDLDKCDTRADLVVELLEAYSAAPIVERFRTGAGYSLADETFAYLRGFTPAEEREIFRRVTGQ